MAPILGVEIADAVLAQAVSTGFDGLPEALAEAGVGYVVLGADRARGPAPESLSPTLVGTIFARRTTGLGIVTAGSPQRDHPYNLARRIGALDHLAHGRAGWLAVRRDTALPGPPEHTTWTGTPGPLGAVELADAVRAARALWRTWPIESLTRPDDPAATVRYADHRGIFPTTGPLNVPTTPQGEPVVFWPYESGDTPAQFGTADVVLATPSSLPADLGTAAQLHLRLDGIGEIRSRLEEFADSSPIDGVLVRLDAAALRTFRDDLTASGLRRPPRTGTLREHLGIARRAEPDLGRHRPVFA